MRGDTWCTKKRLMGSVHLPCDTFFIAFVQIFPTLLERVRRNEGGSARQCAGTTEISTKDSDALLSTRSITGEERAHIYSSGFTNFF